MRHLLALSIVACAAPDPRSDLPQPPPSYARSRAAALGPSTDLNGDGRADACARANAGLRCELSDGTTFPTLASTVFFGDSTGFDDPVAYRSLRFGDITGDGRADVCVRASAGVVCLASTGTGWSASQIPGPPWSDANGFGTVSFADSIRMVDVDRDGLSDLCAITGVNDGGLFLDPGWTCHHATGSGFEAWPVWGPWDGSFSEPEFFLNGVFGVDRGGLSCLTIMLSSSGTRRGVWLRGPADADGVTFDSWPFLEDDARVIDGWSYENGALDAGWATIALANVLPGPDLEAVVLTPAGVELLTWEDTAPGGAPRLMLSAAQGAWPPTTDTVLWGDLSGDGLDDVCARTSAGMRCRLNLGDGTLTSSQITGPAWSDASGWSAPDKRETIRLVDIDADGRADLCGRGATGLRCARSLGIAFAAEGSPNGWSDAAGWSDPDNYEPLHLAVLPPDADLDLVPDRFETCDLDPDKTAPGLCGCGAPDVDTDGDGPLDCQEGCPTDPAKTAPGACGCGTPDTDTDGDGAADCVDDCPADPTKTAPGACGCGAPDADADADGAADCVDDCPADPAKTAPGTCGCGTPDDADGDGTADCLPCGDGVRAPTEECDDAGHVAGDGCSPTCALEGLVVLGVGPGVAGRTNTFTVGGGTPGQRVYLLAGTRSGSASVPGCPGLAVPIQAPTLVGSATATGASQAVLSIAVPRSVAGATVRLVAVETATCRASAVFSATF